MNPFGQRHQANSPHRQRIQHRSATGQLPCSESARVTAAREACVDHEVERPDTNVDGEEALSQFVNESFHDVARLQFEPRRLRQF